MHTVSLAWSPWPKSHTIVLWRQCDFVHDALSTLEQLVSAAVVARKLERAYAALARALRADHVTAGDA